MEKLVQLLESLNDNQKQLLKDTINHGWWGDGDYEFIINGEIKTLHMQGYITNDAKDAGHFSGRQVSAMFRSLYKNLCLNKHGLGEYFSHATNWWGDGSGDVMFIRDDVSDFMEEWAKK